MNTKKEDGITLVQLVITIVILLVLAIVSIVLVNKQGVFSPKNESNDVNIIEENSVVIENVVENNTEEENLE